MGAIESGAMGAYSANQSSKAANTTNLMALGMQQAQLNAQLRREKPFYQAGVSAIKQLQDFKPEDSAAANYNVMKSTRSLNNQLAARGLLGSGNAANRLAELESGIRANDVQQQWGRLTDLAKIGTGAAASANSASQQMSNQAGQWASNTNSNNKTAENARQSLYSSIGNTGGQIGGMIAGGISGSGGGMENAYSNNDYPELT